MSHSNSDNGNTSDDQFQNQHQLPESTELLDQLIALGFDRESSQLAIHFTEGISADQAVNWIIENSELIQEVKMGATSSTQTTSPRNLTLFGQSHPHKMVFVVNTSLKMGAGKMAAQVGHAAVALYRLCQQNEEGQKALKQWSENGEMKIVLKGDDVNQLEELQKQAKEAPVFTYLVADAGHTQIAAGSRTVLGVFGTHEAVDKITGNLKLY